MGSLLGNQCVQDDSATVIAPVFESVGWFAVIIKTMYQSWRVRTKSHDYTGWVWSERENYLMTVLVLVVIRMIGILIWYSVVSFCPHENHYPISTLIAVHHYTFTLFPKFYHCYYPNILPTELEYQGTGILIIKIKQCHDPLIFIVKIPISGKMTFILKQGPGCYDVWQIVPCWSGPLQWEKWYISTGHSMMWTQHGCNGSSSCCM